MATLCSYVVIGCETGYGLVNSRYSSLEWGLGSSARSIRDMQLNLQSPRYDAMSPSMNLNDLVFNYMDTQEGH